MGRNTYAEIPHYSYREREITLSNSEVGSLIKEDGRGLTGISYFTAGKGGRILEITYYFGMGKEAIVEVKVYKKFDITNNFVMLKFHSYAYNKCPKIYKDILKILEETAKTYIIQRYTEKGDMV